MDSEVANLSAILSAATGGDRAAIHQLYAILYPELRALAHKRVRGCENAVALDTTSLVHESYLRFVKAGKIAIDNHQQFLAYAAHFPKPHPAAVRNPLSCRSQPSPLRRVW
jgi:DNA-directed RNA polymerase specialized sigma24 family protein